MLPLPRNFHLMGPPASGHESEHCRGCKASISTSERPHRKAEGVEADLHMVGQNRGMLGGFRPLRDVKAPAHGIECYGSVEHVIAPNIKPKNVLNEVELTEIWWGEGGGHPTEFSSSHGPPAQGVQNRAQREY